MDHALLERIVLGFTGASFAAFGLLTYDIWRDGVGIDILPGMWPLLFLSAGIATIWWAENPVSEPAFKISGCLSIAALSARAVNSVYLLVASALDTSSVATSSRLLVGVVSWLLLAVLVAYTWHRLWPRQVRIYGEP